MSREDIFRTVERSENGSYKEKGSSFLSSIYPLLDEQDYKFLLGTLKKEHPKARHICYAYRWGPDPEYARINDDGEPGGTAGKPILNQLKSYELENCMITVVRYFGGTLLGTSGLTTAYKSAAKNCLEKASIIQKRRNAYFKIQYPYEMDKLITPWLLKMQAEDIKKEFAEHIQLECALPLSTCDQAQRLLTQAAVEQQWPQSLIINFQSKDLF
jgi:uncharacterized YigZ family protein